MSYTSSSQSAEIPSHEVVNLIQEAIDDDLPDLNLSFCGLSVLPNKIGGASGLARLFLSRNQITTLPAGLGKLSNLTRLYLSENQLATLPAYLGKLSNLMELELSGNQLTTLPIELGQLSNLRQLNFNGNKLTTLPRELGQLSNLRELNVSGNKLTTLPKELGQLFNLRKLNLSGNRLTTLPKELGKLSNLRELNLSGNKLTALPKELEQLSNLKRLNLQNNKALDLPSEILGPNSIAIAKGALPANPKDILNYYFRILMGRHPLNEAKLILVGFGEVGKTSLVNRLIKNEFDRDSRKTEGIQITNWHLRLNDVEDVTLNIWDFGGQEIMHSTHQFFLTERSLYLLVLNGRQGHEGTDAEYWLELIKSFGSDSPVLIVLNKVEAHPFDINRGALQQKFPAIRDFIQTDCETGRGIQELQQAIERESDRLEHLRDPFPSSWMAIKKRLSEMQENYISFEQYRYICQQGGEADIGAQDSLAVYLHNLGIALNYKDDSRLRDTHVLNPHWVTNGIYALLNNHEITETKGELDLACLTKILDTKAYPPERHDFLLELMHKFELCFRFEEDENRYLIPDLLDKQQPIAVENFQAEDCLNFRYEYPILPEGLLPRFIVRTYVLSEHHLRWRTGVILAFEGNQALVKADPQDRCVVISINGPVKSRRRLLAVIRSDFERIHHNSFKFKPKELVPVPGHPTVTVSYKGLLTREKKGRKNLEMELGDDDLLDLKVQDLLNGVDLEGSRQPLSDMNRDNQASQLFYSYSHKDETLRDELDVHLKLLQRQGYIQPWHDRRIIAGEEWGKEIDDNLNRSDIILLLISADFVASDYCYEFEVTRAMERHESNMAQVIPIVLRPADWSGTPFRKLQGLPTDAKPVTQWSNRDEAWLNVETGIKNAIKFSKTTKSF